MGYFHHLRPKNKLQLCHAVSSLMLAIVLIQSSTAYAQATKSDADRPVESSVQVDDDISQLLNLWIASTNNSSKVKWAITQFQNENQPGVNVDSLSELSSAAKDINHNTEQLVSTFCEFRRRFDDLRRKSRNPEGFVEIWKQMPLLIDQKLSSSLLSGNDSYLLDRQYKLVKACGEKCIREFTDWCAKNPGTEASYSTEVLLPRFRDKVRIELMKKTTVPIYRESS